MPRSTLRLAPALCAALVAVGFAPAVAAADGPFVAAGTSPERVQEAINVDFSFSVDGLEQASSLEFSAKGITQAAGQYGGEVSTAVVSALRVQGGTLKLESTAAADFVPNCRRGGDLQTEFRTYRLDVPAGGAATVVVTAKVPVGLPGRKQGVEIASGSLTAVGQPATAGEFVTRQYVERGVPAYVYGVNLKVKPAKKAGTYTLSGHINPARLGKKLTFVSRPAKTQDAVNVVFGTPTSVLRPAAGLKKVGTVTTKKGGKFSATLALKTGTAVAARVEDKHRGASCGVLVPLVAR